MNMEQFQKFYNEELSNNDISVDISFFPAEHKKFMGFIRLFY